MCLWWILCHTHNFVMERLAANGRLTCSLSAFALTHPLPQVIGNKWEQYMKFLEAEYSER